MSTVGAHDVPPSRERATPPTWTLTWMAPSSATAIDRTSAGSPQGVYQASRPYGLERRDGRQPGPDQPEETGLLGADEDAVTRRRDAGRRRAVDRRARRPGAVAQLQQRRAIHDGPDRRRAEGECRHRSPGERLHRPRGLPFQCPQPAPGAHEDSRVHVRMILSGATTA